MANKLKQPAAAMHGDALPLVHCQCHPFSFFQFAVLSPCRARSSKKMPRMHSYDRPMACTGKGAARTQRARENSFTGFKGSVFIG